MRTKYERDIYLFLSLYRFFAYGLAVVLIQAVPSGAEIGLQTYLLLATVGVYTLVKVVGPLRWWERDPATYLVLSGDLLVCLLALLFTGGLTSGFLLYSFLPLITAALLFQERLTLLTAGITSFTVAFAHLVLSLWVDTFAWITESNILLWLIFYTMATFLIAISVYRTNLNIRQRIQDAATMEERQRMRREIHDGVAQALSYLSLKADVVGKLVGEQKTEQAMAGIVEMQEAMDETYQAVRESLDQLSVEMGGMPLTTAIEEYLAQFGERNGIHTDLDVSGPRPNLSPVAELQALRIAQGALANVSKHAHASKVYVTVKSTSQSVELCIKDDGQGFDPSQQLDDNGAGHHGLAIMRERTEGLGGTLTVLAAAGEGTEVRIVLPVEQERGVLWHG